MLSFFLGINPFELQKAKNAVPSQNYIFDDKIRILHESGLSYPQIASQMGLSLNTIKNTVYSKNKRPKPRKRRGGKPGRQPLDWERLDQEMLPKVIEMIDNLKNSDKPIRITLGSVARHVGLKSKQIDKLPICKSEIIKNAQSQEVYWAEKVVWAWKKLSSEGRTITIKQIRLKTNMSVEQIKHCLIALQSIDKEVFNEMLRLQNKGDVIK